MGVRLRDTLMGELGSLRYEPTDKRIRGMLDGHTVVDSRRAMLVWEPKRIVPTYAVPHDDVHGEVERSSSGPAQAPGGIPAMGAPHLGTTPVLDPSIPFAVHTAEGEPLSIRADGGRTAAAFRPVDSALDGYLLLDFDGFDGWLEEDEPNVAHPRDPFHRIDILRSSRHVRVELDGVVLAESEDPILLFEPPLPVRSYLPVDDVRVELRPSDTRTSCAYKGAASYWSTGDEQDVAWSYPSPLREAALVTGRIAFFDERVDLVVDGERLVRPVTPWSRSRDPNR